MVIYMKQYKTLENWKGYEKGAVVPEGVATKFLENYIYVEDQSILEIVEVANPIKEEPKVDPVKKEIKKTFKKSSKKA